MPKILSPEQIAQFEREGCVFPIRVMSEAHAARLRARLEEFEGRTGGPLRGDLRHKAHLLFTWLDGLVAGTGSAAVCARSSAHVHAPSGRSSDACRTATAPGSLPRKMCSA